jgi:hypothetical protein
MFLDSPVLGKEILWWFLKFAPSTFNNYYRKRSLSEKRDGNCHIFANSHWKMLLKAVGQPLDTATGKCPKAIGTPLGNS